MNGTSPRKDPQKEIAKIQDQIATLKREKKKDWEAISDTYLALAIVLREAEDWLRSEEAAEDSIKFAKKIKNDYIKNSKIGQAFEEIGNTYAVIQEYPKALKYVDDAINVIEKSLASLTKEKKKLEPEEFVNYSTLTKSLYVEYLKHKTEILLVQNEEKKARESITKPWEKYLKTKDPKYIENLTFLSDIKIHLALKLKNVEQVIEAIGELIILEFFAKKFSDDKKYWSNKLHRDLREKGKILVDAFKIPVDQEILGKETLNILKQLELETKDHMFIDKILELKKSEDYKKNIEDLKTITDNIKKEEASKLVLTIAENDLMVSLAQINEYSEAFEKAKDIQKEIKKIKNKIVKNFILGETQLNLFKVNVRRQDYKQAEKEIKKGIDFFEENINTLGHACFAMLELASCYIMQDHFDKAGSILEKPLEMCEQIGDPSFLARLYELLAGIKLQVNDYKGAAVNFAASAIFYVISDEQDKYREFLTLAINLYNHYMESIGFVSVKFEE
ncbi:MAG: hypothetical protein HWN65_03995 [Candidatus Helarchaeota archaeon]|nr:hypothetical protein [Candidatus Helarchaeota archaeon]